MTENTVTAGIGPAGPGPGAPERAPRRQRADAQRNVASLLDAAKSVFAASGVDAPAKEIADLAWASGSGRCTGTSRSARTSSRPCLSTR